MMLLLVFDTEATMLLVWHNVNRTILNPLLTLPMPGSTLNDELYMRSSSIVFFAGILRQMSISLPLR